jgi:hypothetical protein
MADSGYQLAVGVKPTGSCTQAGTRYQASGINDQISARNDSRIRSQGSICPLSLRAERSNLIVDISEIASLLCSSQ